MANALIYGEVGSGKTVNSTLVRAGKRGRKLLLNSDNSHVVLGNFERPNLDVQIIRNYLKKDGSEDYFAKQFMDAVQSGKYDTIIIDNLTDLIDLALQDYKRTPGTPKDERQHYKMIYDDLKYLARQAGQVDCNVIFTCWLDTSEMTMPDGTRQNVFRPQLPDKILNNICGLCNIVGKIHKTMKDDKMVWYYILEGNNNIYAKDQLFCRKACMPADLFTPPQKKGGTQNAG